MLRLLKEKNFFKGIKLVLRRLIFTVDVPMKLF
jgi:hypothetical protein